MEKKRAAGENFENICSEEIKIARRRRKFSEISNPPQEKSPPPIGVYPQNEFFSTLWDILSINFSKFWHKVSSYGVLLNSTNIRVRKNQWAPIWKYLKISFFLRTV